MASKIKKTKPTKPAKASVAKAKAKVTVAKPLVKKHARVTAKVAQKSVKPVKVVKLSVPVAAKPVPKRKSHFDKKSLANIQDILIKMRDRLTGQISALSDDSLKYIDDSSSDDRTDDFDREFALNLMSSEQDSVFEIDSALRRIKEGAYGFCDSCGCLIEKARLQALPFARACVKCQSAAEKGRVRFRPFGEALEQGVEQEAPEVAEPEENE
jgi:DnaK suppressor protein